MADHAVEEGSSQIGEYIGHHITFLANKKQEAVVDMSVIHWDSVFWSVALSAVFLLTFYMVARKASAGVPRGMQTSSSSWSSSSTTRCGRSTAATAS